MSSLWARALPAFLRVRIEGRPNLQKILANTAWLFSDRFLKLGIGLFVGTWVARYLGPSQYGLLNYAIAFVALFTPIAQLGLDNIVVRNLVQDPDRSNETLGTALTLRLIGAVFATALACLAILGLRPDDTYVQGIVVLLSIASLFQTSQIIDFWFQAQVKSKYTVIAQNAVFLFASSLRVALVILDAPLELFVYLVMLESAMAAASLLIAHRVAGGQIRLWRFSRVHAKQLLSDSWPFIVSGLAIMIYMRIDAIMLGELSSASEVGIYAAAVRLSELWYFIPLAIVTSAFPAVIAARGQGEAVFLARMSKMCRLLALISYAIALPMTFLSGPVVAVVFGESYLQAGPVLAVHIWAGLAVFLGVAYNSWITAENAGKYSLVATIVGAAINVALNALLIPQQGALGAAIATVIAYIVAVFIMPFAFAKTRRMGGVLLKALILVAN